MSREIDLIGGFYRDEPWSAQDTVNWLPVKDDSGQARSAARLRAAPGIKPIAATVVPISEGDWIIFWTLGAENVCRYLTVTDPRIFNMANDQPFGASDSVGGTAFANGKLYVGTSSRNLHSASNKNGPFSLAPLQINGPVGTGRVAKSGQNVVYGAASGQAQYSSDGGLTWIRSTGQSVEWVASNTAGTLVGFSSTFTQSRISSNNGVSFSLGGSLGPPAFTSNGGVASDGSTFLVIVLAASGGLHASRSTDSGASWSTLTALPILQGARNTVITGNSVLSPSPGVFYVMSSGGVFVKSEDSGATWVQGVDTGLNAVLGWGVGGGLIVAAGQSSTQNESIVVSSDGGVTWQFSSYTNPPADFDFDSVAFFPKPA